MINRDILPGRPSRTIHQSKPGVRRRRDSQPSIHFPRSVYSCSRKIGVDALTRLSLEAKKSSLAYRTDPPNLSEARSINSSNSIFFIDTTISLKIMRRHRPMDIDQPAADHRVDLAPIEYKFATKKSLIHPSI